MIEHSGCATLTDCAASHSASAHGRGPAAKMSKYISYEYFGMAARQSTYAARSVCHSHDEVTSYCDGSCVERRYVRPATQRRGSATVGSVHCVLAIATYECSVACMQYA